MIREAFDWFFFHDVAATPSALVVGLVVYFAVGWWLRGKRDRRRARRALQRLGGKR